MGAPNLDSRTVRPLNLANEVDGKSPDYNSPISLAEAEGRLFCTAFCSETPDVFVVELLGTLMVRLRLQTISSLLLNSFALVHQDIEGFGVFKKKAVSSIVIVPLAVHRAHFLGYDGEALCRSAR